MNEENYGGFGGLAGLIVLILVFGFMGGNGWGGFGGGNSATTATETAALVQQDNLRSQVSGIASLQQFNQQFTAGIASGIDKLQAQVAQQDVSMCQLGNNIAQQFNNAQFANQQQFCSLRQEIIDNRIALENRLTEQAMAALNEKANMYKEQFNSLQLKCSQDNQTNILLNAINRDNGCCCNVSPCCNNNAFNAQALSALQTIAAGVTTTNNTLTALSNTATSNTATLAEILAKVSTTTTA